ncbi:hypothetical protein Zmor_026957 [Zophobas morio]|uniref:Uncharacterized protein n=1 Tax=Zophobas morio TaxID=2755281 RepID=A0AA38HWT8_9CUCU|nr:hypothetical protein Zmor_026957 [Zophobas morio]
MKYQSTHTHTQRESIKEKRMMARFRCGNEEKKNNFWMDETDRRCRICWREGETIEDMLERYEGLRASEQRGLDWVKEVRKIRELRQVADQQKE